MSTKNLARTVIEGGRATWSKYLRRSSSRWLRREVRQLSHMFARDLRWWDETPMPSRYSDWDDIIHKDKTNPCERFLIARAGRPWDDVRSEICRRFDRRKLAGMHVTEDHLLNRVEHRYRHLHLRWKFWVDDRGVLRHDPRERW